MDDLSTYNEVETSLKDLSSFLVEKNERYYDDNDEGKEFLIGASTETEVLWNNNKEIFFSVRSDKGTMLFHWRNLSLLTAAGNKITGSIPTEVGKLANLIVLNFSENNLDGALPQEILALTRLETIDLSDWNNEGNGLKGQLPDFANNINLKNILLAGNSFSGSIPATFLNGVSNIYEDIEVDLRWNILTGGIPKTLARLENVELLVTGNSLTGNIPEVFCTKKYWMKGKVSNFGCNAIL